MRRIVLFGATGHTGRLTAERLVAQGERPVLAGRSEGRLAALADSLGGLEWRRADASHRGSVFALLGDGDVLVATVGPFERHGVPAVRAAIAAGATYLDSSGEPRFVRRVFQELGPPAARAGAALLPAMGYDFVPGILAGSLALAEAGEAAERVDVGYYALGMGGASAGTRRSAVGAALDRGHAFRDGRIQEVRTGERVRAFTAAGRERPALSYGGSEHFALPRTHPHLREVNVYVGWAGRLTRPLQVVALATSAAGRVPGLRHALRAGGQRALALLPSTPGAGEGREAISWIMAEAYGPDPEPLAAVHLRGEEPYRFTAGALAWAARRALHAGAQGTGALGPVEAFGLEPLERGCAEAGIERVHAEAAAPAGW